MMKLSVCSSLLFLTPFLTQATARVAHQGYLPLRAEGSLPVGAHGSPLPYDDHRIQNHPDKKLVGYIKDYFEAFVGANFSKIESLQDDSYTMTDIPLGVIRAPKNTWNEINAGFTNLLTDLRVEALTLYGSSDPGSFSIMEHVVWFTLAADPPPGGEENLPPGAKKGSKLGMVNLSVIWWTEEGKMLREFEYGRLTWSKFITDPWGAEGLGMHQGL